MKTKTIALLLALVVALSVLATGCSAKAVDDALKGQAPQSGSDRTTLDGRDTIKIDSLPENTFSYMGIGGMFAAWIEYVGADGELQLRGTKGISYTLDAVAIYDSVYDSLVSPSDISQGDDLMWNNNAFIVLTLTATYVAPEGDNIEVIDSMDLNGYFQKSDETDSFVDRKVEGELFPTVIGMGGRSQADDAKFEQGKQDLLYTIRSGETQTLQVYMVAAAEFVQTENILAFVNMPGAPVDGYTYKCFDLFAE